MPITPTTKTPKRWGTAAALLLLAGIGAAFGPGPSAAAAEEAYGPPAGFTELYRVFPSSEGPESIGAMLGETLREAGGTGPLVLITSRALYVYEPEARALVATADFRLAPDSGFVEMTAVSHVGPAIAYVAALREQGDPRWRGQAERLIERLRALRETNAGDWLEAMAQPVFEPHHAAIRNMVDYAASMAGSYLAGVLARDGEGFTVAAVGAELLTGTSGEYPIPFDNVMVATFALASFSGQYAIRAALAEADAEMDWAQAKVIIRAAPGVNFTAALTKGTQALFPLVRYLSGMTLAEDRIMIVPFAEERASIGAAVMPEEDFDYYTIDIWQQPYSRQLVAPVAFPGVDTIYLADRAALPGDYGYSTADDIGHFMVRMKHSFADPREALSNTVAFWTAGELHAKGWDPAALDVPGLTHGFPAGVAGYPADNPAF